MQDAEILERVDHPRVWQRRGKRAPHQPSLLLFAFGRLTHDEIAIPFVPLRGPPRVSGC
jgi:hypothetical protein